MLLDIGKAFLLGGLLCLIGQLLIDLTKMTPARILTSYVVAGVVLQAIGLYPILMEWGGAGASVPLTGFGALLGKGAQQAVEEKGALGILTGGLTQTSAGIAAAIMAGLLVALLFRSRDKSI